MQTAPTNSSHVYTRRRKAIRDTFFADLQSLPDTMARFVHGDSPDSRVARAFDREIAKDPDSFMRLDVQECYRCLPQKTAMYFKTIYEMYDVDWVIKMDDDVFMAPHRLPYAIEQWEKMGADYVGCMKHGEVFTSPSNKWHEPAWRIVGPTNMMNAYGSAYAVNKRVIDSVLIPNLDDLRHIANEDTTLGLWMAAFKVSFFEDMRLCQRRCHPYGVAFFDPWCQGLCEPISDMYKMSKVYFCKRRLVSGNRLAFIASYADHKQFDRMKVSVLKEASATGASQRHKELGEE